MLKIPRPGGSPRGEGEWGAEGAGSVSARNFGGGGGKIFFLGAEVPTKFLCCGNRGQLQAQNQERSNLSRKRLKRDFVISL